MGGPVATSRHLPAQTWVLLFVFLMNPAVRAEGGDNVDPGLYLSPKSCLLNEKGRCDVALSVIWALPAPLDVCLFRRSQDEALACWQGETSQQRDFHLSLHRKTVFELRRESDQHVLFHETFAVFKAVAPTRRPRRNPWSFF